MRRHAGSLRLALFCCLLVAPPTALGVAPALVDCPHAGTGYDGDTVGQNGFYVPRFPGKSLKDVTLYLYFRGAGTYTFTLTARAGTFDGGVLGAAQAQVVVTDDVNLPVTFTFNPAPAVTPGSIVTFQTAKTSGPADVVFFGVLTRGGCPVIETEGTGAPLSIWNRNGIAVRIDGDHDPAGATKTVTIPAVASIHGVNNAFFHSDVSLFNLFPQAASIEARYYCYAGQSCGTGFANIDVAGYAAKTIPDVVSTLFGSHETAGALELTYRNTYELDGVHATSRVYTPSLPSPTNGAEVRGVDGTTATGNSIFVGLGNNGGSRSSGFRTNAGAYNPYPYPTNVTFYLYRNDGKEIGAGNLLGQYSATWGPNEAKQVNDIFGAAGAGSAVTTDAILDVYSDLPIFSYVTIIDNVTGDSVVQGPTPF